MASRSEVGSISLRRVYWGEIPSFWDLTSGGPQYGLAFLLYFHIPLLVCVVLVHLFGRRTGTIVGSSALVFGLWLLFCGGPCALFLFHAGWNSGNDELRAMADTTPWRFGAGVALIWVMCAIRVVVNLLRGRRLAMRRGFEVVTRGDR